jgi:hypothetical protein
MRIGLKNDGNGFIRFHRIEIPLVFILENTAVRTKKVGVAPCRFSEHKVVRRCQISRDTSFLISLLNSGHFYAEFEFFKNEQALRDCAKAMQDDISSRNTT